MPEEKKDSQDTNDPAIIFDTIDDAFINLDKEWRFVHVNKQAEVLLGKNREELLGKTVFELFPESVTSRGHQETKRAIENNIPVQYEQYSEPLDRWFSTHIYPVDDGVVVYFKDITERKRAEERDHYLAKILENISDAVVSIDADSTIKSWNIGAERTYGWTAEEAIGKKTYDLVRSDFGSISRDEINKEIETKGYWRGEITQTRKDGRRIIVLTSVSPIKDSKGKTVARVAVSRDITHRREAERTLKRLASIVESSSDAIIGMRIDSTIISWNKGAERLYGWKEAEMIGRKIDVVVPPSHHEELHSFIKLVQEGKQLMDHETRRKHKNGEMIDVSLSISPITDSDGTIVGVSTIARDIRDRKHTEAALKESEERFRTMNEAMPQIVWTARADGVVDFYNKRWEEFTGMKTTEGHGSGWKPVVHPDDAQATYDAWENAVRTGTTYYIEHRIRNKDGEYRWLLSRGVPLKDANGTVLKWFGTATDIHDTRAAEEALKESETKLQTITNSVPSLIAYIDKDLRYRMVNRTYEEWYCRKQEEFIGKHVPEMVGEKIWKKVGPYVTRVLAGEQVTYEEWLQYPKKLRYVRITYIPDISPEGVRGFTLIADELTEHKHAEDELRSGQERFRAIFEQAAVGMAYLDSEGQFTRVNQRLTEITGYSEDELKRLTFREITHPEDLETDLEHVRELVLRKRDSYSMDKRYIRKDGSIVWIRLTGSAVRRPDGSIENFIAVIEDIDDKKKSNDALHEKAKQQGAAVKLGIIALSSDDLQDIFDNSVRLIAEVLNAEYAKILELIPENNDLVFRAGVGWDEGVDYGKTVESMADHSPGGYTLISGEPVLMPDAHTEARFEIPELMHRHGIESGMSTIIWLRGEPYGVLGAYTKQHRAYTKDDVQFLQIMANILGMALERHYSEESVRESENRFRRLADDAPVLIWMSEGEGRTYFNKTWITFTGNPVDKERGEGWMRGIHPDDLRNYTTIYNAAVRQQQPFSAEYRLRRTDGEYRWMVETGSPRFTDEGDFLGHIGSCMDITEHKQSIETIRHQALHDPLTTLPNRKALEDRLTRALIEAQEQEQMIAVMFLDIDNFKQINDTYGHTAGDLALKEIGARFRSCVRDEDTVARLGGDEFIILLRHIYSIDDVLRVADRIFKALKPRVVIGQNNIQLATSIGITLYPTDGTDIHTLLKNADRALYRAKEAGKNRYHLYNRAADKQIAERFTLETELREGIQNNELVLHYQPIVHTQNKRIVGVEALVRWNHPRLGLIYPNEFIPVAEAMGLIVPLGEWVLREACRQNKAWQDAGLPVFSVAVNLSAHQFAEPNLVNMIKEILGETGMSAECLELEITESVAMGNLEHTITTLNELADMGVHITLDDFGTGYSSLSYLKRFPVHNIKIDQSFVRNCLEDEQDAAIIKTIITMAYSLGLKVVAEGVEKEEQAAFLHTLNCHRLQGYLIKRPAPGDDVMHWIQSEMEKWQESR